ncbi:ATP-binding protein [Halotia wernerae UHCC 0503]|nr:ATP-binding protein [Halotia wernerae UHCC 0503]
MKSMVCNHETARLEALYRYHILDTAPEQAFDDLVSLAAQICDTPIALINLIDANRQWFKAKVGLDVEQMPRNVGFGSMCINSGEVLIISDTLADQRFATEVVVTLEPYARFYAGVPLIVPEGEAIGTLCVLDHIPRQISQKQIEALLSISRMVVRQLESRRNLTELTNLKKEHVQVKESLHESECNFRSLFDSKPMMGIIEDTNTQQDTSCDRLLAEQQIPKPTDITQTEELEEQFIHAQRMESIGTLTSSIAHDLNNVLSPILISVQLLKGKFHEQNTQQILSIIENNAKHGANLVKQILSFVRGIEGDVPRQAVADLYTVIQVKHLILEMQQIVQQTFPKSIILTTDIQPSLLPVNGDSTQLYQVLMNLCLNARDAMPEGGHLKISAENIFINENCQMMYQNSQVGNHIILTVADTGLGIDREILDKIFEPFFTTKEFNQGTGLGLSTVRGIIKKHGGFITVSSDVGKGTKFQVYLPAV